ncbi:YDG domain-containing protein [Roseateles cavernae]|uniref:YDG domain-containing protein n=1 Tax=Roseateles cavernae TaxID=3153578 RepID=UPI0032E48C07
MNSSLNHTYRLIWNERTQAYVAVAETTTGRGKRASGALLLASLLACGGAAAQSPAAGALPSGGSVVAGQAQLSQTGKQLQIDQSSHKLVMNWSSFDIGSQAEVKFVQPGSDSVALNRVTGGAASAIFGKLQANGQVWLVNPNGVVFGRGASVDVGGLVASSLAISDADFLAGRSRFEAGAVAGAVRNEGGLRAAEGGVVALIAPQVENSGSIQAPGGSALLGAGAAVSLDFAGDGLLSLTVERAALDAHVGNSGRLSAGLVQLSAAAAGAVRASVVNNEGVIEAQGLSQQGGRILLDGGAQGEVHVGGRLDASGGEGGGRIRVSGEHIRLDGGATLDASGAAGGGQIHVGGGWQGKDASQRNATTVTADAGVTARANGGRQGQGGEVVFWSDDATRFAGTIEVKGGSQGGDGGRAEVSGKQTLNYSGRTDARAAKGRTGDLLLDPATITVKGGGSGSGGVGGSEVFEKDLEAQSANVLLQASGNINFADLNQNGGDGKLSMQNNVSLRVETGGVGGNITFANKDNTVEVSGSGSIMLVAGGKDTGQIINAPQMIAHGSGSNPGGLPVHDVTQVGSGTPGAASITLFGADGVTVGGSLSTNGGYVRIWADSDAMTGGSFTLNAPVNTRGGNLYIASGNEGVVLNSSITLGAGRLFFDNENAAYGGHGPNGPKTLAGTISASGDLEVNTAFTFKGGANIHTDGLIRFGNVGVNLDTGAGTLTLRASGIDWGGATLNNLSTASLRLEPHDKATNMVLGDAGGFASATTLAKLPGIKNLTIGREDGTGTISVASDFSFNASGHFEMVNKTVDITAGTLTNTGGGLTLTGDTVNISKAVTANGGAGKVTIRQMTAANELHLGTGLNNSVIGQVNAATLAIGRVDGGNLVFDSDISTTASSVHLMSGARVEGINGGVAAANLAITAGGGAEISNASFDFNKLALKVGGDTTIAPNRMGSFGLGTVDGLAGLEIKAGSAPTVNLTARQTIGVNAPIKFNNSAATLNLRGAQLTSADASTQLSGHGAATITYDTRDGNALIFFGNSFGGLGETSLARFNGVKKLVIGSDRNTLEAMGDLNLAVGELEIRGRELRTDHAITNQGHVRLHAQNSALALNGAVTAAGSTLALSTGGGQAISASGVLTAAKLALRTSGDATLNTSSHQLGELAAEAADLKLTNGRALTVGTADGLAGVTVAKTVDIRLSGAGADLVLDRAVSAGNAGNAARPLLLAAGGNFHNRVGSAALSATGGSWEVYSSDPTRDTVGGLAPAFKQYKARVGDTVLGSGNGLLYSRTAQVIVGLSGVISKVYDGNTSLTLHDKQMTVSAGIDGDIVSVKDGTAAFADKNVGNKAVHVKTATITARNGAVQVYGYEMVSESWAGDITRKTISVSGGVTAASKVYDGQRTASLNGSGVLAGLVDGDAVAASFSGQFADKNVGVGKTVLADLALTGADAGNYQLDTQTLSLKADITPRQIMAGAVTVAGKVYDGNRSATVSGGTLQGLLAGDTVNGTLSGEFVDKNAGSAKDVAVTLALSGADAGNYQLDSSSQIAKGDISRKSISAGAVTVAGKVYDGNTVASVGGGALQGLIGGDAVAADLSGQFADKNVGVGKDVAVTLALKGADAGNYQLDAGSRSAKGDITQRLLSAEHIVVAGKVYDGNSEAEVREIRVAGVLPGEQVLVAAQGRFADPSAGRDKPVAISAVQLSGADAANYRLDSKGLHALASIDAPPASDARTSVLVKPQHGNGTQAISSAGMAVTVLNGADMGVASDLVSGGANAGFNTEQALYGAGQYSIAVDAPALEQPLRADVPVFSQRAAAQPESLGRYLLTDLGDSLAVLPGSQAPTPLPEQAAGLRYSGEAMLLLSARQTSVLRLSFDDAGGLRVEVPAAVAALGHEVLSAYALSALKRDAGIGLDQVRAVVLHYGSV